MGHSPLSRFTCAAWFSNAMVTTHTWRTSHPSGSRRVYPFGPARPWLSSAAPENLLFLIASILRGRELPTATDSWLSSPDDDGPHPGGSRCGRNELYDLGWDRRRRALRISGSYQREADTGDVVPLIISSSSKGLGYVELPTVLHHVVARACQFMRDGLDGDHRQALGALLLVPALDGRVVANREVSCFDKRPCKELVAALGVAFALLLAV